MITNLSVTSSQAVSQLKLFVTKSMCVTDFKVTNYDCVTLKLLFIAECDVVTLESER